MFAAATGRVLRTPLAPGFSCVGCGARDGRLWTRAEGWSVGRCRNCGLLRTWPVPDTDVLRRAYEAPSYFGARTDGDRDAWAQRAAQILSVLPDASHGVLDFGAGEGHLVRALRGAGVHAHGVEPSPA
ncbi:MAG: hypothetical protein H0W96_12130, partial [Solirubrobacterales bacterium]|nr:hypothetical protein [Solirubrobacterales bacterium]